MGSQGRSRQFDSRSRTYSARSSYSRDLGQESGRRSSSHTDSAPSGYSRDPSRGYSGGGVRPNLMRRGFGGGSARGGFGGGYARGMSPFYRRPYYSPLSPFYASQSGLIVRRGPSIGDMLFRMILSLFIVVLMQSF